MQRRRAAKDRAGCSFRPRGIHFGRFELDIALSSADPPFMWFIVIGLIALGLKVLGYTFVADLDWPWVLSPFALTVLWWNLSDGLGLTRRARMRMIERRKQDRRRKLMASLGFMDRRVGSDRRRPVPGGGFQDSISTTISWEESIKKK